ncbi:hypothetical protein CY0110_17707 [Crocosphaera chwakensis CCY0110]|uniref:Uncharacterized protein n=1 Tax=Crocosphaera chwakensis CCY0110 TaxID=391612 RepID=A3IIM3_9CHRO|nr:hypothetical protein CY0110_17707 [Crocosphaera chwakensis CCY0110]
MPTPHTPLSRYPHLDYLNIHTSSPFLKKNFSIL